MPVAIHTDDGTADGAIEVFGRGKSGALIHQSLSNNVWSPTDTTFDYFGRSDMAGSPTALQSPDGTVHVFARSTSGDLLHQWRLPNGAWQPTQTTFEHLGRAEMASSPTAVVDGNGTIDVFARALSGNLLHQQMNNSVWSPSPTTFDHFGRGEMGSAPTVVVDADGTIELFARSAFGDLLHWTPSATIFEHLGVHELSGEPSAVEDADGNIEVFGRSSGGDLIEQEFENGAWVPSATTFDHLGRKDLSGTPTAFDSSDGSIDVFGRATNGDLIHQHYVGASWSPSLTTFQHLGRTFLAQIPGTPVGSCSSSQVTRGQQVTVRGSKGVPGETISLRFNNKVIGASTVDGFGNFTVSGRIPASSHPGTYPMSTTFSSSDSASNCWAGVR